MRGVGHCNNHTLWLKASRWGPCRGRHCRRRCCYCCCSCMGFNGGVYPRDHPQEGHGLRTKVGQQWV